MCVRICVCDVAEVSFNFEHERRIININYMLSGVFLWGELHRERMRGNIKTEKHDVALRSCKKKEDV